MADEYILKRGFGGDGAYFFYKNGLLHREAGPAYISEEEIEESSQDLKINLLVDEHLYKKEILELRCPEDFKEEIVFEKDHYTVLSHYILGIPYSEEEFNILILKNQLVQELSNNNPTDKKLKI